MDVKKGSLLLELTGLTDSFDFVLLVDQAVKLPLIDVKISANQGLLVLDVQGRVLVGKLVKKHEEKKNLRRKAEVKITTVYMSPMANINDVEHKLRQASKNLEKGNLIQIIFNPKRKVGRMWKIHGKEEVFEGRERLNRWVNEHFEDCTVQKTKIGLIIKRSG